MLINLAKAPTKKPASGPKDMPDIITIAVPIWIGSTPTDNRLPQTVRADSIPIITISLAFGFLFSNTIKKGSIVYTSIKILISMYFLSPRKK